MANDLATLTSALAVALDDTTHDVWAESEKQALITQSVNRLYPMILKYVVQPVTVTTSASFIDVGGASYPFTKIVRIDLYDSDPTSPSSRMMQEVPGQAWEVQEQFEPGSASRVYINPRYSMNAGYYYLIHGYVRYDLSTNLIPDYLVPLVLARARAEAYRRIGPERVKFKNWLTSNQTQNTSVNELIQFINEADREAESLERMYATVNKRPVVARR